VLWDNGISGLENSFMMLVTDAEIGSPLQYQSVGLQAELCTFRI
jgi:hypothetical protein